MRRSLASLGACALIANALPAKASADFPALPGVLEEYRGLRAGAGVRAEARSFEIGHLRVRFESGEFYPILTRSGRETGFLFEGDGSYTYQSDEPADRQTIGRNISAIVRTKAYDNGRLAEEIRGCFFIGSGPLLAHVLAREGGGVFDARVRGSGADEKDAAGSRRAESGSEPPERISQRLAALVAGADEANIGVDHLAARALLGGSGASAGSVGAALAVYGELDGGGVNPGYSFDPAFLREERLILFRNTPGGRIGTLVSRQPAGARLQASPVVLTRLDFTLTTANNRDAEVTANETLVFDGSSGRIVEFKLVNHQGDESTSWRSKSRSLEVSSVRDAAGKQLPFSHRYNELLVELPEPPHAGETVTLSFDLAYHFLARTDGDQYFWLGTWSWYPSPSWENSVRARCHWKIRTKPPYRAIAPGSIVSLGEENGFDVLEADLDQPTDFPTLLAGRFELSEATHNGVLVRANLYGPRKERGMEAFTRSAFSLLDFYGGLLGPYPQKDLNIVEVRDTGFWQSPSGLVIVSGEALASAFTPAPNRAAELAKPPAPRAVELGNRAFAHEMAHQWFGDLVIPKSYGEHNWLSESLAEYLGAMAYSAGGRGPQDQSRRFQNILDEWRIRAGLASDSVSISQAGYLRGSRLNLEDSLRLLYGRGPLVLQMLRTMIGNERFYGLLRSVVAKYAHREIGTEEFAAEASAAAGQDLGWFFRQWINEPGTPEVDVSKAFREEGGRRYLVGTLKQRDPEHFKRLVVPFVFRSPGGGTRAELVVMDRPEQPFRLDLPEGASSVEVDPSGNNLARYHVTETR